jgi:hypothetical protein
VCTAPVTGTILTAYDTGGRAAGITAYRKALTAGGVEPPDIPGVLTWGGALGVEEHEAFWSLADHLELAITAGDYTPGSRGWKDTATRIARDYLTVSRLDLGGDSYLDRIHTERRTRWATSRGPGRAALTQAVLPLISTPPEVPGDAEDHLTQVRWMLARCDGDGAMLTVNHTLGRALLTEACHRFDWLILGKQAPPETSCPRRSGFAGSSPNSARPAAAAGGCCSPPRAGTCCTPAPPRCGAGWPAPSSPPMPRRPVPGRSC